MLFQLWYSNIYLNLYKVNFHVSANFAKKLMLIKVKKIISKRSTCVCKSFHSKFYNYF